MTINLQEVIHTINRIYVEYLIDESIKHWDNHWFGSDIETELRDIELMCLLTFKEI